jgi:hypothetical protein
LLQTRFYIGGRSIDTTTSIRILFATVRRQSYLEVTTGHGQESAHQSPGDQTRLDIALGSTTSSADSTAKVCRGSRFLKIGYTA